MGGSQEKESGRNREMDRWIISIYCERSNPHVEVRFFAATLQAFETPKRRDAKQLLDTEVNQA